MFVSIDAVAFQCNNYRGTASLANFLPQIGTKTQNQNQAVCFLFLFAVNNRSRLLHPLVDPTSSFQAAR